MRIEIILAAGSHGNAVRPGGGGQAYFARAVETDAVELALQRSRFGRDVIELFLFRVDAGK